MMLHLNTDQRLSSCTRGEDAEALGAIHDIGVMPAIWERDAPVTIGVEVPFEDIRFEAATEDVGKRMLAALRAIEIVNAPALSTDIGALAVRYARLMQFDRVSVRLDCITNNACKQFHTDNTTVRPLCTYQGHGTQWLDREAAEGDANQLRAGDVSLFKGRLLVSDGPIVHRSPPIEGTGGIRCLLVIDPPAEGLQIARDQFEASQFLTSSLTDQSTATPVTLP